MRFSIIVPVYNVAPFVCACLDSLLAQSEEDWEAICIDDGSTDGSGEILDQYAEKDSRIRVIHKVNGGVSSARNRGLEEAKGEWILFLDGDDVWHPETLKVCLEMINSGGESADLVNFTRIKFLEDEQPNWLPLKQDYRVRDLKDGVRWEDMRFSFCTFAYRRDVACAERFPRYVVGEDLLYRARCLNRARRIVSTENVLFAYRMRKNSVSHTRLTFRKYSDRIKYLVKWLALTVINTRRQPKGLVWRLAKDFARSIVTFR